MQCTSTNNSISTRRFLIFSETQLLKSLWVVGKPWKPDLWQQLFSEPKMWRLQYFVLFEVCGFCTAVQVLVKTICNIIQETFSSQQSKEVKSLPAIWATRSSSSRWSLCFVLNKIHVVICLQNGNYLSPWHDIPLYSEDDPSNQVLQNTKQTKTNTPIQRQTEDDHNN